MLGLLFTAIVFPATRLPRPIGFTATISSPQGVMLSWAAPTSGTGFSYQVFRNGTHYATTAFTQYNDVTVNPGASYSYQVFTYDGAGNLLASSKIISVTLPMPDAAIAPPPQASTYTLVYANDFTNLDIGQNWTGQFHDWYTSEYGATKAVSPTRTSVANSVLSLDWLAGDGANDSAVASFDIGGKTGRAFRYGYFEARMSWSPVAGAWPAFWLLSLESATNKGKWGELDAFEGQGLQPGMFYGTVHDWTAVNGVRTQTWNQQNGFSLGAANDYSQWHKYGVLWQPGSITWYFDDNPVITAPEPAIMENQDAELIFDMAEDVNWIQGNTTGVTAADLNLKVDWVRVWQHAPSVTAISPNGKAFRGN